MKLTCGVFVINPDKTILVGHPTHHPEEIWTIPKGEHEENESETDTAIRELREETGIDLMNVSGTSVLLGYAKYHHGKKQLFAFAYFLNEKYKKEPVCSSMVEDTGEFPFPEIDKFEWVKCDEAMKKIHYTQQELLKKIEDRLS